MSQGREGVRTAVDHETKNRALYICRLDNTYNCVFFLAFDHISSYTHF